MSNLQIHVRTYATKHRERYHDQNVEYVIARTLALHPRLRLVHPFTTQTIERYRDVHHAEGGSTYLFQDTSPIEYGTTFATHLVFADGVTDAVDFTRDDYDTMAAALRYQLRIVESLTALAPSPEERQVAKATQERIVDVLTKLTNRSTR